MMGRIHGYVGGHALTADTLLKVGQQQRHGDAVVEVHHDLGYGLGMSSIPHPEGVGGKQIARLGAHLSAVVDGRFDNADRLRSQFTRDRPVFGDRDGELALAAYAKFGPRFVTQLSGIFAIAIIDARHGEPRVLLYTDPVGGKPLYVYLTRGVRGIRFASELTALESFSDFPTAVDPLMVDRFLGGRALWRPHTIYAQVQALEAGTVLDYRASRGVSQIQIPLPDEHDSTEGFHAASELKSVVRKQITRLLRPDSPTAVIADGGPGSAVATALAAEHVSKVAAIHVSYAGHRNQDVVSAVDGLSKHCDASMHEIVLDPADLPTTLERTLASLSQPHADPAIVSLAEAITAAVREGYSTVVSADGAKDLLAGHTYHHYAGSSSHQWLRRYQDSVGVTTVERLTAIYSDDFLQLVRPASRGHFTDRLGRRLAAQAPSEPNRRVRHLLDFELAHRIPAALADPLEQLGLAHDVQAHLLFLQPAVVQWARTLPTTAKVRTGTGMLALRQAARGLVPTAAMYRSRQCAPPLADLLVHGQPLHTMIGDIVLSPNAHCAQAFRRSALQAVFACHTSDPKADTARLLWAILILELWLTTHGLWV